MKLSWRLFAGFLGSIGFCSSAFGQDLSGKVQKRLDEWTAEVRQWASAPVVVDAVAAQNAALSGELAALNQEKWESSAELDPVVRGLSKNPAAEHLRRQVPTPAEAFLSDAQGRKVAFLSKPSNWSHLGKPKHDDPMAGKLWQGKLELDKSSGTKQIQIGVPVMKDGVPIGSLVVGFKLSDLTKD